MTCQLVKRCGYPMPWARLDPPCVAPLAGCGCWDQAGAWTEDKVNIMQLTISRSGACGALILLLVVSCCANAIPWISYLSCLDFLRFLLSLWFTAVFLSLMVVFFVFDVLPFKLVMFHVYAVFAFATGLRFLYEEFLGLCLDPFFSQAVL